MFYSSERFLFLCVCRHVLINASTYEKAFPDRSLYLVLCVMFFIEVDLEVVARATTGFTGADLANLINQAALKGCVDDKDSVTTEDIEYAM